MLARKSMHRWRDTTAPLLKSRELSKQAGIPVRSGFDLQVVRLTTSDKIVEAAGTAEFTNGKLLHTLMKDRRQRREATTLSDYRLGVGLGAVASRRYRDVTIVGLEVTDREAVAEDLAAIASLASLALERQVELESADCMLDLCYYDGDALIPAGLKTYLEGLHLTSVDLFDAQVYDPIMLETLAQTNPARN
jgi:hypothetical protein